jgi:hypothetical protein
MLDKFYHKVEIWRNEITDLGFYGKQTELKKIGEVQCSVRYMRTDMFLKTDKQVRPSTVRITCLPADIRTYDRVYLNNLWYKVVMITSPQGSNVYQIIELEGVE